MPRLRPDHIGSFTLHLWLFNIFYYLLLYYLIYVTHLCTNCLAQTKHIPRIAKRSLHCPKKIKDALGCKLVESLQKNCELPRNNEKQLETQHIINWHTVNIQKSWKSKVDLIKHTRSQRIHKNPPNHGSLWAMLRSPWRNQTSYDKLNSAESWMSKSLKSQLPTIRLAGSSGT